MSLSLWYMSPSTSVETAEVQSSRTAWTNDRGTTRQVRSDIVVIKSSWKLTKDGLW